jgi:hypothetical protein
LFVAYDRGTERSGQYAAQLVAYFRYRDCGDFRRDYNSFPVLLVVTTTEAAEARFLCQDYLIMRCRGSPPLRLFLTTTRKDFWGRSGAPPEATWCALARPDVFRSVAILDATC